MFLTKILSRMLQNATRRYVAPAPDANTGPAVVARGVCRPRQVDGPTVPLPPVNSRYVSRLHPDVQHINRSNVTCARRGSIRQAVGL